MKMMQRIHLLVVVLSALCWTGAVWCRIDKEEGIQHIIPEKDTLMDFFSASDLQAIQKVLKQIPQKELKSLENLAGRVIGKLGGSQSEGDKPLNMFEEVGNFQSTIMEVMKNEDLVNSMKDKLGSLVSNDKKEIKPNPGADKFQSGMKHANKDDELPSTAGKSLPKTASSELPGRVQEKTEKEAEKLKNEGTPVKSNLKRETSGEQAKETAKPPTQNKKEAKKKAKKKQQQQQPMDALVGLAKQYLGQADSDPTLNIIANLASSYMNKDSDQDAGLDFNSLIQMASLLGGNSGQGDLMQSISSLLDGSGFDMEKILQMGTALLGQKPGHKSGSPVFDFLLQHVADYLDMDRETLKKYFSDFSDLMDANSWEDVNEVMRSSAGTDAENFLDLLSNDDIREQLAEMSAEYLAQWIRDFAEPEVMKMRVFYVNSYLLRYNYPAIDPKNLIASSSAAIDRISLDLMGSKVMPKRFLKRLEKKFKTVLRLDPTEEINLRNISQQNLANLIQFTINQEVLRSISDVWTDVQTAMDHPECARTILCMRNSPNRLQTILGLKEATTRAAT